MKKPFIIAVSFLFLSTFFLYSSEVGTSFTFSNIDFTDDRAKTDTEVSGTDFLYGLSVFGNADVSQDMNLETGLFYDPILKYSISALLSYRSDFFELKAGPFFGVFNDFSTILKPGISTEILVDVPGVIFGRLSADSSIGGRLVSSGDYLQEKSVLGVGFYIPNAICEASLSTKTFTEKTSAGEKVSKLQEYAFSTDIYQKNRPYRFELTFGYQTRTLTFIETSTVEHTFNSLILGTRIDLAASSKMDLFFDLKSNIYSFGEADGTFMETATSGLGMYLFSLETGVSFRLDE